MSEIVMRFCYGYFYGPCYLYKAECGARVELHHKYCHSCGKELVKTWQDEEEPSPAPSRGWKEKA